MPAAYPFLMSARRIHIAPPVIQQGGFFMSIFATEIIDENVELKRRLKNLREEREKLMDNK